MKFAVLFLLCFAPVFLCSACSSSSGVTVTRTEVDSGSSVELSKGDTLAVVLEANPTTGYGWVVAAVDTTILHDVGAQYVPDEVPKGIVGSGGRTSFRFQAIEPGKTGIELEYRRSWETTKPPAKTFILEVSVKE